LRAAGRRRGGRAVTRGPKSRQLSPTTLRACSVSSSRTCCLSPAFNNTLRRRAQDAVDRRNYMPTRIGINGFGRMRRLALRAGAPSTMVVDSTCVKVLAWYDNEIGCVNRMIELTQKVSASL
jgi:hypothetical protein